MSMVIKIKTYSKPEVGKLYRLLPNRQTGSYWPLEIFILGSEKCTECDYHLLISDRHEAFKRCRMRTQMKVVGTPILMCKKKIIEHYAEVISDT